MAIYGKIGLAVVAMVGLVGCAAIQQGKISVPTTETTATVEEAMSQCLRREAIAQIQNGSAFAASVRTTAKAVVTACLASDTDGTENQADLLPQAIRIINELMAAQ